MRMQPYDTKPPTDDGTFVPWMAYCPPLRVIAATPIGFLGDPPGITSGMFGLSCLTSAGGDQAGCKYLHPAWSPPADVKHDKPNIPDVIPGGSPRNPMGVAAMTLNGGQYAIHGTNVPSSAHGSCPNHDFRGSARFGGAPDCDRNSRRRVAAAPAARRAARRSAGASSALRARGSRSRPGA